MKLICIFVDYKLISMVEDWKNDRAEVEMRQGTDAIMRAAIEKEKIKESEAWESFKISLAKENPEKTEEINTVVELIRRNYKLPEKK